jgi:hypothetical protein
VTEQARIAHHEAAHAVIATLNGIEVGEISLSPARCWVREPHGHREVVAHIRVLLAGALIDERYEFYASEPSSDRLAAATLIDGLGILDDDEHDRSGDYQSRLFLQTARHLDQYWPVILTVAEELTTTGQVSGMRVRQIVASARPVPLSHRPSRHEWTRIFREIFAQATGERA